MPDFPIVVCNVDFRLSIFVSQLSLPTRVNQRYNLRILELYKGDVKTEVCLQWRFLEKP